VPEAGSGGGGGGTGSTSPYSTNATFVQATGGGGGAGGGFVDFTASGDIIVSGSIDARGGNGGNGVPVAANGVQFGGGGGGGGGGSGGGIRLLTPSRIRLAAGASIRVDGGIGGTSPQFLPTAPANPGGNGGVGRLTLEDADSVIEGYAGATVIPLDGQPGFYRGPFDSTRFKGGGSKPFMVSQLIDMGPANPIYLPANQTYNVVPVPAPGVPRQDFIANIPAIASRGVGKTSIFVEVQGYSANADGTANLLTPTGWKSVGYFTDSGSAPFPNWTVDAAPPVADVAPLGGILSGNNGNGVGLINGRQFMQMRITFFLNAATMGPFDAGPSIDQWELNFSYNQ
jgi:hypothetical protein